MDGPLPNQTVDGQPRDGSSLFHASNSMRLACIIPSVSRRAGGPFTSVRRLMQGLEREDVHVSVRSLKDEFTEDDLFKWRPLDVRVADTGALGRVAYARGFAASLRAVDADILSAHGLWTYLSLASLRWHRRAVRPVIIHPHGMLDPWAVQHSRWKKRVAGVLFEYEHLRSASCIRALCQSEADAVRAFGLRNPVAVIPNGIDVPADLPARPMGREAGAPKTLLFLGRIHPKKGLAELLHAWARFADRQTDWRLVIAGWDDGGHIDSLLALCAELGLKTSRGLHARSLAAAPTGGLKLDAPGAASADNSRTVQFPGPVFGAEKDALLRSVDAFILPSYSEGLPMAVLEAWAYGLPVLMTPECNLPEGLAAEAALQIQATGVGPATPWTAASLSHATESALRQLQTLSPSDLVKMGANGRRLVEARFTWQQIAQEMKAVCEWAVGGGPAPECVQVGSVRV